MAEKPNVDGPEPKGGVSEPTPTPSGGNGAPVAGDAERLSELVKQVLAEELKPIKGEIGGLYSRQDKDRNQFRDFMDEFKKQKAIGLSDTDAEQAAEIALGTREREIKRDRLIDKLAEKFLDESSTPTPGKGQGVAESLAQVILDYKLDANDPGVAKILADHKGNDLKAASELGRHAASIASRQTGDPSASTSINATAPVETTDAKTLWKEYQKDVAPLRGNVLAVTNLQKEYRKRAQEAGVTLNI